MFWLHDASGYVHYVDAKSDVIAFCERPSGSFIKNRTNMHEMQNRMKIALCETTFTFHFACGVADKVGPT